MLEFDIEYLGKLGIEIKLNTALGRDFKLADLKAKGFSAFKVIGAKGEKSDEQLFEFDPTAGRMILIPALQR